MLSESRLIILPSGQQRGFPNSSKSRPSDSTKLSFGKHITGTLGLCSAAKPYGPLVFTPFRRACHFPFTSGGADRSGRDWYNILFAVSWPSRIDQFFEFVENVSFGKPNDVSYCVLGHRSTNKAIVHQDFEFVSELLMSIRGNQESIVTVANHL